MHNTEYPDAKNLSHRMLNTRSPVTEKSALTDTLIGRWNSLVIGHLTLQQVHCNCELHATNKVTTGRRNLSRSHKMKNIAHRTCGAAIAVLQATYGDTLVCNCDNAAHCAHWCCLWLAIIGLNYIGLKTYACTDGVVVRFLAFEAHV